MAPFVEIAHTDKPVKTKIDAANAYTAIDSNTPVLPTIKPTLIKTATLHIDNATGKNTPCSVLSDRTTVVTINNFKTCLKFQEHKKNLHHS